MSVCYFYVDMLFCCSVAVTLLSCCYATMLLWYYVVSVLICCYVLMLLCCYHVYHVVALLGRYVVTLLCDLLSCRRALNVVMLLCLCYFVAVLLSC